MTLFLCFLNRITEFIVYFRVLISLSRYNPLILGLINPRGLWIQHLPHRLSLNKQ